MNLRHQETFCIVLLISTISITLGHDFQFASEKEEEEVQPMLAEPLDVVSKAKPIKSIYSKEKAHCHETQNRIILSLVLRSHSWDEIVEKKRQKAVNKLSKFFLIPKENFVIDDVNRLEVHQMTTNAIRRGRNNLNSSKRKLGRIGFLIGCDKTIFPSEKLIANTIAQQMKERALDDISGLDFGWWSIWTEHPEEGNHQQQQQHHYHQHRQQQQRQKQLLQGRRVRRQTSEDDYDNDDDDYDYNYDDEDEAEPTEIPQHAHRHHHGDGSQPQPGEHSTTNVSPAKSIGTVVVGAGLNQHGSHREMEPDENNLIAAARVLDRTTVTATADAHGSRKTGPGQKVHMTQTEPNDQFDFTQADIRESVSQLESTITKTIRNNEQLKQEEESLLARKSSKHKPIDIERIVETELMLPDIEQLKGRDVFKDDYVIEDMVTPVVSTKKVPVSTVIKKPHSSSGTAAITATISPTSKSPVQSSSRMGSSRSTIKTIPNGGSSTTLATRKATTPEMTTRQTTATFTTEPTNDANLSNQRWTSSTKEEFTSDTSITSGNTVPNKQQHSPAVTNPTTTQITTTRSTPATTTKRAEIFTFPTSSSSRSDEAEAEAATINHHVTIDVTITTPLLPLNPTTTTVTSTTSSVTTSRVTTLVPRGAVEQREDKETLVSTTATNIRSTNENKSDYKAVVPATAASLPLDGKVKATTPTTVSKAPAPIGGKRESNEDTFEENYDDEYDDELEEELPTSPATPVGRLPGIVDPVAAVSTESTTPDATTIPSPTTVPSTSPSTTIPVTTTTTTNSISTEASSTASTTVASTASTTQPSTTELDEPTNLHPIIRNRIPKQAIIAGKVFSLPVPLETFYDAEDGNNLRLELFDSHGNQLKNNSWVQFNVETREIYGLPLEKDVSKWHYILQAVDSGEQSVNETVDVSVQQHKSHRSVNHEISLALRLQRKFARNVDWQIEVIRGIAKVLGDVSLTNIVVREVRNSIQDPNLATFVYTNETLPKDRCPEEKLEELVVQLTEKALNDALNPDILVKSVQGQQIGQCLKSLIPKVKPTQTIATKNFAPTTRNQVDRVNATVGHLLVYKVPIDTFYDPEDGTDLKLKLLTTIRSPLDQYHWLQFDSKNHEFFGIPRNSDIGQKEYLLMAEDREGLTATDALVVVVHQAHPKRDHSVLFELTLDTTHEQFSTAQTQRRFIERLAQVFGDANTNYIQIRNIRTIMHSGQVQVAFYNTTLYRQHQRCPNEEIESMRNILMYPDGTIRAKVREILGQEFSLQNVSLIPVGTCQGYDTPIHVTNEPEKTLPPPIAKDDYLLTFVLPAVIILTMLLIAFIIACILYRRRLTGKMELEYINFQPIASQSHQGTDEERKSFRSKGIPVIFQDELDEKPEIGNKSPVILKDEKPPLLPPSYSSTNNDGENDDLDEYVPPPAVVVGGRESRGKSPVTPSYRRPPPYVSP
ncbi:uncharacterized protein LOC131434652 isoform X3 [Malaya genurostris]|uniref:uncharacterized protein LOC131434652 isoform X3 n=1 Tax=Malaya genurostris TaxID=325434 RepID=UPI0026F3B0B6|nr:uncharacterized protein LOC131434652 isoform X3 [Malaya genurostris]